MTDTRTQIRTYVDSHPGVHFNGLVRSLDLAPGQVQHHVRRLVDAERLVREEFYGRTHYYPPGYDAWERTALAMLRRETARDVVAVLYDAGEARPDDVADQVDIARSTLEHHLDGLVAGDIVAKHREGNRVTLSLSRPDETLALLGAVEPTLAERLTDRFERLVDSLLEPPERD